jgi:hypothetical protein
MQKRRVMDGRVKDNTARPAGRLILGLVLLVGAGCAARSNYLLTINATAPERSQVCEVPVDSNALPDGGAPTPTNCSAPGDTLEADHQLAVRVVNALPTDGYELRTDQTSIGGQDLMPAQVLSTFMSGLFAFGSTVTSGLEKQPLGTGTTPGSPTTVQGSQAGTGTLGATRDALAATNQTSVVGQFTAAAQRLIGILPAPVNPSQPVTAEGAFRRYLVGAPEALVSPATYGTANGIAFNPTSVMFGAPSKEPTPRAIEFDAATRGYLNGHPTIHANELGTFVSDWCAAASFGNLRREDGASDTVLAWLTAQPALTADDILSALALDSTVAQAVFRGQPTTGLTARIAALTDEVATYQAEVLAGHNPATVPSHAAFLIWRLTIMNNLRVQLGRCIHNIDWVTQGGMGAAPSAAVLGQLTQARTDLENALPALATAKETYERFVRPFVIQEALVFVTGRRAGDDVVFGSRGLQAGRLVVAVARSGAAGPPLFQHNFTVRSGQRVSVSVGAVMTFCDSCETSVVTSSRPSATEGTPPGRFYREERGSYHFDGAVMLNIPFFSRQWGGFEASLGYPITRLAGDPVAALLGAGVFFEGGVHLGLGVSLGRRQRLLDSAIAGRLGVMNLPPNTPREIDLSLPANAGLTVDQVSEMVPAVSGFITLTASPELLTH